MTNKSWNCQQPQKNPNVISIKNTLNNIFTKNFGWNTSVHPQEARQTEKTKTKHLGDQVLLTQSLLSNNIFLYHFTEFAYSQDISYVIRKQKTNQKENFYKIIKKKTKSDNEELSCPITSYRHWIPSVSASWPPHIYKNSPASESTTSLFHYLCGRLTHCSFQGFGDNETLDCLCLQEHSLTLEWAE